MRTNRNAHQEKRAWDRQAKGEKVRDKIDNRTFTHQQDRDDVASVRVTDHAIVRYIIRVMGFTRAELADKVLPRAVQMPDSHKTITLPVNGTHLCIIKDGAVVSVVGMDGLD